MILLLDNYDSFTFNLQDYLQQLGWEVQVRQNDRLSPEEVREWSPQAIVFSPGPKRPAQAGQMMNLIHAFHRAIPMLGICLGHQGIGEFFGAKLVQGSQPVHGKTAMVYHQNDLLFAGLPNPFPVMRYHSLVLQQIAQPLTVIGETEDRVVMAIRHQFYPLWGVQFHPESIGTPGGLAILSNWSRLVKQLRPEPGNTV